MAIDRHVRYFPVTQDGGVAPSELGHLLDESSGAATIFVMYRDGRTATMFGIPQCSPDAPAAGHWSIVPA